MAEIPDQVVEAVASSFREIDAFVIRLILEAGEARWPHEGAAPTDLPVPSGAAAKR